MVSLDVVGVTWCDSSSHAERQLLCLNILLLLRNAFSSSSWQCFSNQIIKLCATEEVLKQLSRHRHTVPSTFPPWRENGKNLSHNLIQWNDINRILTCLHESKTTTWRRELCTYSWMFKWSMSLSFSSFTIAIDKRRRLCAACASQKNFSSSSGVEHAVSVTRPGIIWRLNRRKKETFRSSIFRQIDFTAAESQHAKWLWRYHVSLPKHARWWWWLCTIRCLSPSHSRWPISVSYWARQNGME